MAQSVEQLIRNQQVAGSSPASSSKNRQTSTRGLSILLITYSLFTFHQKACQFLKVISNSEKALTVFFLNQVPFIEIPL